MTYSFAISQPAQRTHSALSAMAASRCGWKCASLSVSGTTLSITPRPNSFLALPTKFLRHQDGESLVTRLASTKANTTSISALIFGDSMNTHFRVVPPVAANCNRLCA